MLLLMLNPSGKERSVISCHFSGLFFGGGGGGGWDSVKWVQLYVQLLCHLSRTNVSHVSTHPEYMQRPPLGVPLQRSG